MKKILSTTALVGTLFVLAAGSGMASPGNGGGNDDASGDIRLTGTMPAICEIDIDTKNTSLDMKDGAKKQVVAEITETCNDHEGYTISFTSANAGKVVHGDTGQGVAYSVSYDTSNNSSLANAMVLTRAKEGYGVDHDLVVDMSGSSNRVAGTYRDTITVEIAAK